MTPLAQLAEILPPVAWMLFGIFLRVGAAMAVLPGLGERMIPVRVRLLISLAMTAIVAAAIWPGPPMPAPGIGSLARLVATETIVGLALGLGLRLIVLALQTAGSIAAQSTSLSQLAGNSGADPMPAMGNLLMIAALALMMVAGLHVKIAALFIFSYDILPFGLFPDPGILADWAHGHVTRIFALAFTLAAPFVILSILYNLTLGVINRAMPQLMVAFVGAPVITFGAIGLLFVTAPLILSVWLQAMDGFLSDPFGGP
ncbi:flagellar biosynthetic protein FliR [Thalassococcus sp. BH17M4-6]|uniref:flagellar biosynthetic protein FliR n=1 Tax=Thalassococcus sp. BH17M4-6 TaxID=3413148 RepID=UPI003BBF9463